MQTEMAAGRQPDLPPTQRRRSEIRQRSGTTKATVVELSHASFSAFLHSPERRRARKQPFISITRSIPTTNTRWPRRSTARSSATSTTPRRGNITSALEAALFPDKVPRSGLRQPDRFGPSASAGPLSLLRPAAAEDAASTTSTTTTPTCRSSADLAARHTWDQAVEVGDRRRSSRWAANIAARWKRAFAAAGATAMRTAASRAAPSAAARSTAIRTS